MEASGYLAVIKVVGVDHPVDGIGSTAADADDFDDCEITAGFHESFRPDL